MADAASKLTAEALSALQKAVEELPDACDRLRYVKQMTEKAANKVFDLADALKADGDTLSALAANAPPEAARALLAMGQRQSAMATELMMSQDFQDLSGQVVNKVIALMRSVERPMEDVLAHAAAAAGPVEVAGEVEALAGVQTPDKALKQDDVDDLLASMGF